MPSFSYLLISLQGAWAAVTIQVPSSPVQARPRSDTYLPCHFSLDPPRAINIDFLVVRWLLRGKTIAKFDTGVEAFRPRGAVLDEMRVREGNATLFLPDVRDEDAGDYMCFVLHTPDSSEGKVTLKIEAPPSLTLGPTEVPLSKPSNLTCAASNFYPDGVFVKWLRNGETLKADSPHAQRRPNHLFYAESVLNFIPQISDAGVTFSCHIQHRAVKNPISRNFELKMKAPPELYMVTRPQGRTFLVAECIACCFYPRKVKMQWLENGELIQDGVYDSDLIQNPNGTFSIRSIFFPQQGLFATNYTCQVQHETLQAPLEKIIPWEPIVPGFFEKHKGWFIGSFGILLGLSLGAGSTLCCQRRKAKNEQAAKEKALLKKMREQAESQKSSENPDDVLGT